MIRFRNFLLVVALLVGAAILGAPAPAHATYEVAVYDDGTLAFTATGSGSLANTLVLYGGSTTHFTVTSGSSTSNFPGLASGSNLNLGNSTQVSTTAGFVAGTTNTLTIVVSENGWMAPTSSLLALSSSAGGSAGNSGTANMTISSTYTSYLDSSAGNNVYLNGTPPTTFVTPAGGSAPSNTTGNVSVAPGTPSTNSLVYNPASATAIVAGGTPFTMTSVLTFQVTLAAGDTGGASFGANDTTTANAVPAPAGLVLALTGLPCLGIGTWLRRRQVRLTAL